jgi:hypothetical protein
MIPQDLVRDTFSDLITKYDLRLDFKSKMKFNIYSIEDLPLEIKEDIKNRLQTITECIGRTRYDLDHPIIFVLHDKKLIRGGIWSVRIY